MVEPDWIEITKMGSAYDVEIDVRADPEALPAVRYRHREHAFSGQPEREWIAGLPPE